MQSSINRFLLALLIGVCLFGTLPSWAGEATAATQMEITPAAGQPTDPALMSLEQIMTPASEWQAGGPNFCTPLNSRWCTYRWNYTTQCCYATFHLPGASCPELCP